MMHGLSLTSEPSSLPVALDEARAHVGLRADSMDWNAELTAYIRASDQWLSETLNRQFVQASYRYSSSRLDTLHYLPRAPLVSVELVTYLDSSNVRQTLDAADYDVITDREPGLITPAYGKQWPTVLARPDSVQIDFTCGLARAADRFKALILFYVGQLWNMRVPVVEGQAVEVPLSLRTLLYNARHGGELKQY